MYSYHIHMHICFSCILLVCRLSAQTVNTTVNVIGPSTKLHLSVGETNLREYVYQNHLMRITRPVAINSVSCITLCNATWSQYVILILIFWCRFWHWQKTCVVLNLLLNWTIHLLMIQSTRRRYTCVLCINLHMVILFVDFIYKCLWSLENMFMYFNAHVRIYVCSLKWSFLCVVSMVW